MTTIREAGALAANTKAGRFRIQLITPGKGSSGTYPQDVLEAAGRDRIFAAGLPMFIDHQTDQESWSRPEGSIKDLAAVLTEDAHWDEELGALVAEARIFEHWRPVLEAMKDDIGVSIRAGAEVQETDAGRIVTRITESRSVDFVTRAGRGGKILEVMESKRDPIALIGEVATALSPEPVAHEAHQPRLAEEETTPTRKEAAMATNHNIEEAEYAALTEKAGRVDEAERKAAELTEKLAAIEAERGQEARRAHVASLVEAEYAGISAPRALANTIAANLAGDLTDEQIVENAKADAAEAAGPAGHVTGLGDSKPTTTYAIESDELPTYDELAAVKGA